MELRVLGCHGGESPKHKASSFLLDGRLAIDAGSITSILTLEAQQEIEAVLISHAHMDHVRDLSLIAETRAQQGGPPLQIVSTGGTIRVLKKHYFNNKLWPDFSKIPSPENPAIAFRRIKAEKIVDICGFEVQAISVNHTVEAVGFVIGDGEVSVAYSGDTGPTERFWEILKQKKDLGALLMEVSFPNKRAQLALASGHHTPKTLVKELRKLGKKRDLPVFLFHIKPVFYELVEKELSRINSHNISILQLGDHFLL